MVAQIWTSEKLYSSVTGTEIGMVRQELPLCTSSVEVKTQTNEADKATIIIQVVNKEDLFSTHYLMVVCQVL